MIQYEAEEGLNLSRKTQIACLITSQSKSPVNENRAIATNLNQPDLYYLDSILVSTGDNLNEDHFLGEEVWPARGTPVDKPFNLEHDENKNIGHITECRAVCDGVEIPDVTLIEDLPPAFDLATKAVIYTYRTDEEEQKKIAQLVGEIALGEWSVSMEVLFDDFDYIVDSTVIKREKATAHLSKSLKAYGGEGMYDGKRVRRVLRKLTFSGKGLVKTPANPRSEITSSHASATEITPPIIDLVYVDTSTSLDTNHKLESILMEELKKELDAAKAALDAAKADVASTTEKLVATIAEKAALAKTNESLTVAHATLESEKATLSQELTGIKSAAKLAERTASLVTIGLDDENAKAAASHLTSFSDEAFTSHLEVLKKVSAKAAVVPTPAKVETPAEITKTEKDKAVAGAAAVPIAHVPDAQVPLRNQMAALIN